MLMCITDSQEIIVITPEQYHISELKAQYRNKLHVNIATARIIDFHHTYFSST